MSLYGLKQAGPWHGLLLQSIEIYVPLIQSEEYRSSKAKVAGSSPAGDIFCACSSMEEQGPSKL